MADSLAMRTVDAALDALAAPGHVPFADGVVVPAAPGLYAVHANASTWSTLGLDEPPDDRPLYVGKAERSLAGRDLGTHFATGKTGHSTLRRSLAGLLAADLDLRAQPRSTTSPGHFANYGIENGGDQRLTGWMLAHLRLATWAAPPETDLAVVEKAVLGRWQPPLNLSSVTTPWRPRISAARRVLAQQARAWRP